MTTPPIEPTGSGPASEPFKQAEDAQRFVLKVAYEHFRRTGEWPNARELDLEFGDVLDPMGGLELLTRHLGSDKVRPVSPASPNDFVVVTLKGLADLGEARDDLERFLDAVRFAAKRYRESRGKETTLRVQDLIALPGFDAAAAKRAATLFGYAEVVSGGGGPDQWGLPHAIRRFANLRDLDDYFARVNVGHQRGIAIAEHAAGVSRAGRGPRTTSRPFKRIFLSHAADDGSLAHYLDNVLRQGSPGLKVFVASRAGDIPTGRDWLDVIESELKQADAYLLLLTPFSVGRFWLWYESGAAWMSERPFIPVTAAGLAKGNVPYPLGALQALSLEDPGDVTQLARDLAIAIPDADAFCETVRQLSKALPHAAKTPFQGVTLNGRFFDWDGPIHKLDQRTPVPNPPGLTEALQAAGAVPSFGLVDDLRQFLAKGLAQVYETDRQTWRREILYSEDGDQVLFVRPPLYTPVPS